MSSEQRAVVLKALENHAPPARTYKVSRLLEMGQVSAALEEVTPAEMFAIAAELSADKNNNTAVAAEIRREATESSTDLNYEAISRHFGTPKPTLANSYVPE